MNLGKYSNHKQNAPLVKKRAKIAREGTLDDNLWRQDSTLNAHSTGKTPFRRPVRMLAKKVHRIKRLMAFTVLCFAAAPCFPRAAPATTGKTNLTPAPIRHTVECQSPHKDLCVIKKPVGTGYRILTPEITLEDAGEYWLADFIKSKLTTKKMTFRVMGKDNDIHEIEILFRNVQNVKSVPQKTPATPTPNTSDKTMTE